jgi:MFS superfamily sulfate permease-like transporter
MTMDNHHIAAGVGVATIATIILWNSFKPEKLKAVPAPLVAVIVGTLIAWSLKLDINLVNVPASLTDSLNIPGAEQFAKALNGDIIVLALVFAFVASAETLLCATAVDQMHTGARTKYDKELRAQGIGNLICGAVGALPWLLNNIPTAVLAAILVYTGYKLVNIAQIRKIASFGRAELLIYFATLICIVSFDLLTGVLVGFALATAKLVWTFTHVQIDTFEEGNRVDIVLHGAATFFSIPQLAGQLETVKPGQEVHMHFEYLDHIDHACLDMLSAWEKQHAATGGKLVMEWKELQKRYRRPGDGETSPLELVRQKRANDSNYPANTGEGVTA